MTKPLLRKLRTNSQARIERLEGYRRLLENQRIQIARNNIPSIRGHSTTALALVQELEALQHAFIGWSAVAAHRPDWAGTPQMQDWEQDKQDEEIVRVLQQECADLFGQVQVLQNRNRKLLQGRLRAITAELAALRTPHDGRSLSAPSSTALLVDVQA